MALNTYIGRDDTTHYLGRDIDALYVGRTSYFELDTPIFNPEASLGTPDRTETPGTFDWTGPATGSELVVFAMDFNFPTTVPTQGLIFEQGGSGRGIILLIRNGHLRFRFGDGGTAMTTVPTQGFVGTSATGNAKYIWDIPVTSLPFDGNDHTIVWEVEPRNGQQPNIGHRAWIDGVLLFDSRSSNRVESDDWSGSASGGFLTGSTNMPNESTYSTAYAVQSGEIRMYLNKAVTEDTGGGDPPTGTTSDDQFIAPTATNVISGTVTGDHTALDENPANDGDFISLTHPAQVVFDMVAQTPENLVSQRFRFRTTRDSGQPSYRAILRQGTTVIATYDDFSPATFFANRQEILSAAEMASITDYSNLNILIETYNAGTLLVSWLHYEIITNA